MTQLTGLVLTGFNDGEYHTSPDGWPYLKLPQPLPVSAICPGPTEFPPSPEPIIGGIIEYRHVTFEWHNPYVIPERVKMGYWVPLNDETRKYRDDAEFRMWVMRHLTERYIITKR